MCGGADANEFNPNRWLGHGMPLAVMEPKMALAYLVSSVIFKHHPTVSSLE